MWHRIAGPLPAWTQIFQLFFFISPLVFGVPALMASLSHFTADIRPRGTWMVVMALAFNILWPVILIFSFAH